MTNHRAATAAELERKIAGHLPQFARPLLLALIARVRDDAAAEYRRQQAAEAAAHEDPAPAAIAPPAPTSAP